MFKSKVIRDNLDTLGAAYLIYIIYANKSGGILTNNISSLEGPAFRPTGDLEGPAQRVPDRVDGALSRLGQGEEVEQCEHGDR